MISSDPSAPKPNLNVRLYSIPRSTLHGFRRRLPAALVPPRTSLAGRSSIGITTCMERYDVFYAPSISTWRAPSPRFRSPWR
jgi:hypothetical protein